MSNPGYCPECKESGWACTCRADHYSKVPQRSLTETHVGNSAGRPEAGASATDRADPQGDAEWLREHAHDLVYDGLPLNIGARTEAMERLKRIADRLSTSPMSEAVRRLNRLLRMTVPVPAGCVGAEGSPMSPEFRVEAVTLYRAKDQSQDR